MKHAVRMSAFAFVLMFGGGVHEARAEPTLFSCKFTSMSFLQSDDEVQPTIKPSTMSMQFVVDGDGGYVIGNNGTAPITVSWVSEGRGLLILETVPSGVVQITAIDKSGLSVHSRHTFLSDGLFPQQHYGRCAQE